MGQTSLAAYGRSSGWRSIAGTPFALPPSNLQARLIFATPLVGGNANVLLNFGTRRNNNRAGPMRTSAGIAMSLRIARASHAR